MKLAELSPTFLRILGDGAYQMQDDIDGADGIQFLCPMCFVVNNGRIGTHGIICWRPHVPQTVTPIPGRWEFKGTGYFDLSLVAGSSSVFLTTAPCRAHFHVTDGEIR